MHQRFRHVTATVRAEVALRIRHRFCRYRAHANRIPGKIRVVEWQRVVGVRIAFVYAAAVKSEYLVIEAAVLTVQRYFSRPLGLAVSPLKSQI